MEKFLGLLLFLSLLSVHIPSVEAAGGGTPCAACTTVLQLVLNLMVVDNSTFDATLINLCTILPEPYTTPCILFAEEFGPELLTIVGEGASSDNICQGLGVCTNATCRLFPNKQGLPYNYRASRPVNPVKKIAKFFFYSIFFLIYFFFFWISETNCLDMVRKCY